MANTKLPQSMHEIFQVRAFAISLAAELADGEHARSAPELLQVAADIEDYIWSGRKKLEEQK